jgi:DNA-binding NtrC family response regulator
MPEKKATRGRVLIVEDEAYVRQSLGELLEARGYDVSLAASVEEALTRLPRAPIDVVLTDLRMPGADGLDLVGRLQSSHPEIPVVVLTGQGTIASAVECIRAGASDYLLKPADPDDLEMTLRRVLENRALRREVGYLRSAGAEALEGTAPLGESAVWKQVMRTVQAAAPTDAAVLLLGESGTGKELLARLIHRLSARARGPYVRVNCAAIPLDMWESEFFGHRKGSFTGAVGDHEGRFRLAHGGTLFMDEIGAMSLSAQAKILRVLQDGEFDRLGDEQPTRVDVRIISATNSNLEADVQAGRFRPDLYYRLNVLRIELPPLRDRREDIPLLAQAFVREISARLGRGVPAIAKEVLEDLKAYSWPGNVRELRNVLERALILNPGDALASFDLTPLQGAPAAGSAAERATLRGALAEREKEVILKALKESGGVRKEAARILGIDQRNLGYYLHKHGIDPDRLPE